MATVGLSQHLFDCALLMLQKAGSLNLDITGKLVRAGPATLVLWRSALGSFYRCRIMGSGQLEWGLQDGCWKEPVGKEPHP